MSDCHIANQISQHCNSPEEAECEVCLSSMTEVAERGHGLLICDSCGHKVWADGDEYGE